MQERQSLSEVTACQVLIGYKFSRQKDLVGIYSKADFEKLLTELEDKKEDPLTFIRDKLKGKHISGNHRWEVKERYFKENSRTFESKPFWFLTFTQIYIGLRPDHAR